MTNQLPYTFVAGTKAVATQVNENFTYVLDTIESTKNTLNNQIAQLQGSIIDISNQGGDTILNLNEITSLISFSSAVLTISSGLNVQIPNGLSTADEDGVSESQYLDHTLTNSITKTYTTSSSNSILTIDNQGDVHEYLSYTEAAAEPTGTTPLIYLNTTDNKMYKKLSDEDSFTQCYEAKIADGFTRGEDGTITAINSIISPIVALSADTVHTAQIKVNALLNLPELENDNNFVNTMLEFTLSENCSLSLPNNIIYSGGEPPEITADGVTINRLIFDTTSGGDNWCCYFSSLSTSQNSSDENETEAA